MNVLNVPADKVLTRAGEELKKVIKKPRFADFVKTGMHKERPPFNKDWWYVRAAAILRSIYKLGPIGVSKLRTKYGGRKNRGVAPDKYFKGSGSIIRKILQQLEQAGLIKKVDKGVHKGRIITPKGKSLLDKIAVQVIKENPRIKVEVEKEEKVEKTEVKKEKVVEQKLKK